MFKTLVVTAVSFGALIIVGYLLMGAGKPISDDLSVIGQGKPVLVLAYENFSPTGGEALNHLRKVSSDYEARLVFVVADVGTPQGRAFADHYKLIDGQAIFLKPDGKPLRVTNIPSDEQVLRNRLESGLTAMD